MFEDTTIAELMEMSITEIIAFFNVRLKQIETQVGNDTQNGSADPSVTKGVSTSRATRPALHVQTSPEFEAEVLQQIRIRLQFLEDIGLGYLALDRGAPNAFGRRNA